MARGMVQVTCDPRVPDGAFVPAEAVFAGALVKVRAVAPAEMAAEARRMQREVADKVRAAGAARVSVEAPDLDGAVAAAGGDPEATWRGVSEGEALRRWLAERPPRGVDAEMVLSLAQDALAEAKGGR